MTVKDLPHHVAFAVVFPIWSAVSVQARRGSRQVMLQTTRSAKAYLIHLFQVVQIRALTEQFIFFSTFTYSHQESMASANGPCSVLNTNT